MGQFVYKAVDDSGRHVSGQVQALDRPAAVSQLLAEGCYVTEIALKGLGKSSRIESKIFSKEDSKVPSHGIKGKDILAFTNQLSTALRAGLPLLNAIEIIRDQQHKHGMKNLLTNIAEDVRTGSSLSDSMSKFGNIFKPLYLSMVRVGETGGMLEKTTSQLTSLLDRDEKIKTSMKNASMYPLFVLSVGLIASAFIVAFVMPKIIENLGDVTPILPLPTRMMLGLSHFLQMCFTTIQGWFIIFAAGAGVWGILHWLKTSGKVWWDGFRLKVPMFGQVLCTIAVGRFARTLGELTRGGVTILESLAIVRDTLGNEVLAREIDKVADKVKTGSPLSEPLSESGYFPPLLTQITSVGEQTGKLDELLLNAADTFDEEADAVINRFMSVFPAFLILVLALIIGFIIIATLLPILQLQSVISTM